MRTLLSWAVAVLVWPLPSRPRAVEPASLLWRKPLPWVETPSAAVVPPMWSISPKCQATEIAEAQLQPLLDSAREYAELPAVDETMARWQQNLKEELDAFEASGSTYLFDSIWLHMIQTYDGGDYVGNPALIEAFCTNAVDTYTWLADMGFPWKPNPVIIQGSLWQRSQASSEHKSGVGFINVIADTIAKENLPSSIFMRCPPPVSLQRMAGLLAPLA